MKFYPTLSTFLYNEKNIIGSEIIDSQIYDIDNTEEYDIKTLKKDLVEKIDLKKYEIAKDIIWERKNSVIKDTDKVKNYKFLTYEVYLKRLKLDS